MFENADGRTDAGVTGILIAHIGAFGSGELKINTRLAFICYPNGNEMDQMVRNDIACNCIPIIRIAFRYVHISI